MNEIKLFEDKKVRTAWDKEKEQWLFSVVDVCGVLTERTYEEARKYWKVLKMRLKEEGSELVSFCYQLKMRAEDGKMRDTDVLDTKGILRLVQSIPSKKAEPFKMWLAQVGHERIEEIQNPELANERVRGWYEQKGFDKAWIEKRMRGMQVRGTLTDEWKQRGVKDGKDYAILTAEISKATFGMTPSEYKEFKSLENPKINLRDHMTDLELIFTMLGEASTTEIAQKKDAQGFFENKVAAQEGGAVAGNARKELESKSGGKVSTRLNNNERLSIDKKK
jgi:hypothetical protein